MKNPLSALSGNKTLSKGIDRLRATKYRSQNGQNLSETEVWVSSLAGSGLVLYGLRKRSVPLALLGGALTYRGVTRHCPVYQAAGINRRAETSARSVVTIQRPAEEVYRFCSDFRNFPQFMTYLKEVRPLEGNRQRWTVQPPSGEPREFTVEVYEQSEPRLLRWRALDDAPIRAEGSLEFERGSTDQTTRVRGIIDFGHGVLSRLARPIARYKLRHDLRRLKQLIEAGEVLTVEGQPSGREPAPAGEISGGYFRPESAPPWRAQEQGTARTEAAAHP